MIIIGHKNIPYFPFFKINSSEDLKHTLPNSAVIFDFDFSLAKYCQKNDITYAVRISKIKDLMFANTLGCSFAITMGEFSKTAQKLANEYMFDMKILSIIKNDTDLEEAAMKGIDGVVFEEAFEKIT